MRWSWGLVLAAPLAAQQPAAVLLPASPSLADLEAYAIARSPDLATIRLRVDSANAERTIARSIPNPFLQGSPNNPYQYSVSLPIDLTPQRFARTRSAALGAKAAILDLEDGRRQLSFAVRQAYYDLLLADSLRALAREQRDIYRGLLTADSVRFKAGDVPERNVVRSELELSRAEASLAQAGAQVQAARLALQVAIGVPRPDTAFTVGGEMSYRAVRGAVDDPARQALEVRPDLLAARERVDQARAGKRFADALLIPTPTLSVTYQKSPFDPGFPSFGSNNQYAFGLGITAPLFYWYGGERARAEAAVATAVQSETKSVLVVQSDVALAFAQYGNANRLVQRYTGGLLAKADSALAQARFAYRAGATSLIDLYDAIRTYLDTRLDYFTALHDYWIGVHAVNRAVGKDILE